MQGKGGDVRGSKGRGKEKKRGGRVKGNGNRKGIPVLLFPTSSPALNDL